MWEDYLDKLTTALIWIMQQNTVELCLLTEPTIYPTYDGRIMSEGIERVAG